MSLFFGHMNYNFRCLFGYICFPWANSRRGEDEHSSIVLVDFLKDKRAIQFRGFPVEQDECQRWVTNAENRLSVLQEIEEEISAQYANNYSVD